MSRSLKFSTSVAAPASNDCLITLDFISCTEMTYYGVSRQHIRKKIGHHGTHFLDGVLDDVACGNYVSHLPHTMHSVQSLFLCHRAPLRLHEVNARCYCEIKPVRVSDQLNSARVGATEMKSRVGICGNQHHGALTPHQHSQSRQAGCSSPGHSGSGSVPSVSASLICCHQCVRSRGCSRKGLCRFGQAFWSSRKR